MTDQDLIVKESTFKDIKSDVMDIMPEEFFKVYPYRMVFSNQDNPMVSPNTTSIISITNTSYDNLDDNDEPLTPFPDLDIDEKGNPYFTLLFNEQVQANLDTTSSTSTFGASISNELSIQGYSEDKYVPLQLNVEQLVGGGLHATISKGWVDIFVMGEPFDKDKYESGQLPVYVLGDYTPGMNSSHIEDNQLRQAKMNFINFKTIIAQANNFDVYFWEIKNGTISRKPVIITYLLTGITEYQTEADYQNDANAPQIVWIVGDKEFLAKDINGIHSMPYVSRTSNGDVVDFLDNAYDHTQPLPSGLGSSILLSGDKLYIGEGLGWGELNVPWHKQEINGIKLGFAKHTLIHSIKAKGVGQDIEGDIDFITSGNYVPFKMTPISVQDKLTMFADWWDYDMAPPYFLASAFINNASLSKAFTGSTNATDLNQLIIDMLTMSYCFATQFSEPSMRYTTAEAAASSNIHPGDLKAETYITSQKISAVAAANKNPVNVIDGIMETYLRKHPEDNDSDDLRLVKEIFAMLSRYIYSKYAIGKGQNSFNEIYLPWFLQPVGMSISKPGEFWTIPITQQARLKSRWFDVSNGLINPKSGFDISEIKMIQTDRKLTLPELGDTITTLNKIPLAGDIQTNSSNDLRYMFYLNVDSQEQLANFMLASKSHTTNNANAKKTFNTNFLPYGQNLPTDPATINEFIKSEAAKQFSVPKNQITVDTVGSSDFQTSQQQTLKIVNSSEFNNTNFHSGDSKFLTTPIIRTFINSHLNDNGTFTLTDLQTIIFLREYLNTPSYEYEIISPLTFTLAAPGLDNLRHITNIHIDGYKTRKYRFINNVVNINGAITTIDFEDRRVLFDKEEWVKFLADHNFIASSKTEAEYDLLSKYNLTIDYMREIIISSVFGDYVTLDDGSERVRIKMHQRIDESIGIHRIIFA